MRRFVFRIAWLLLPCVVAAAEPAIFNWEAQVGGDRVVAFRMWLPDPAQKIEAVVFVVPGRNGDGRPAAEDPEWQGFARRHRCALMACKMQGADYWSAQDWSGRYVLQALDEFAKTTSHPELGTAKMAMWGHSAGGQFSYSFICWRPDRVLAIVENRGHYINWEAGPATRRIPALWIAGEKDDPLILEMMGDSFTAGRRGGAPWAFSIDPGAGHEVGRSKEFGILFFEAVFRGREAVNGKPAAAWIGDLRTHEIQPAATAEPGLQLNNWLPDETFAKEWHAFVTGVPFPSQEKQTTSAQ